MWPAHGGGRCGNKKVGSEHDPIAACRHRHRFTNPCSILRPSAHPPISQPSECDASRRAAYELTAFGDWKCKVLDAKSEDLKDGRESLEHVFLLFVSQRSAY